MNQSPASPSVWSRALPAAVREIEEFIFNSGWDQPPRLFALVPTADLVAAEPTLADRLPSGDGLTPIAQDPLDEAGSAGLAAVLEGICWPDGVSGCALAQEIVVLPPAAEAELDRAVAEAELDRAAAEAGGTVDELATRFARNHPDRREARLVVGVLRNGEHCCLLRIRGLADQPDELVEHADLAPNMVTALRYTLEA